MIQIKNDIKVLIVIPALNQFAYTANLLKTYKCTFNHALFLIDNGSNDETTMAFEKFANNEGVFAQINKENFGAAASWNMGLEFGFNKLNCTSVLILNNDILLLPDTLDRIILDLEGEMYGLVSAYNVSGMVSGPEEFSLIKTKYENRYKETPDFSCFGINKMCFDKVGFFDEAFYPAYFEDNDYHFRMKAEKVKAVSNLGNIYFHFGSRTKLADPRFEDYIKMCYVKNRDFYLQKWGGIPGEEKFILPFDGASPENIKINLYEEYKDDLQKVNR